MFDELGCRCFPSRSDMTCSCPDWSVPCKHASAVLYVLAEAFDDDPFLVLAWRGRAREELLDALRGTVARAAPKRRSAGRRRGSARVPARRLLLARHLAEPGSASARRATAPPELLLRALDPPPIRVRHIPLVDILRPAYRALADDDQAS